VIAALAARSVHVDPVIRVSDHSRFHVSRAVWKRPPELWLATEKDAVRLGESLENIPVWVLEERVSLPRTLVDLVVESDAILGSIPGKGPC
jgi:hypothetical protein